MINEENAEQLESDDSELANEDFELPVLETSKEDKFFGVTTQINTESENEVEVQVIEDSIPDVPVKNNEEEIDSVTGRVQKRIDKLKYEYHEERRAKEDAQKMRDEAVNAAQSLNNQLQQAKQMVTRGQQANLNNYAAKAEAELEFAKKEWSDASDEGDKEAILNAQEKMLDAKLQLTQADAAIKRQPKQAPVPQTQQAPVPQNIPNAPKPEIEPLAKEWLQKNDWFSKDKKLTGFAMGVHEELIAEGINPQTQEYYQRVDAEMSKTFPDNLTSSELEEGRNESLGSVATTRNAAPLVAPATRNNGGKPRKVQLTPTQVSLAKRLGLTAEQYAKQIVKETNQYV
tara:strand:+ start:6039 stop:7070 length:1032 start_codon:yes stop_codon:yes gene_type:complete